MEMDMGMGMDIHLDGLLSSGLKAGCGGLWGPKPAGRRKILRRTAWGQEFESSLPGQISQALTAISD